MAQTRQEIRQKWKRDNMKSYGVSFHKEHKKELIAYVEKRKKQGENTSDIFADGIEKLIESEGE